MDRTYGVLFEAFSFSFLLELQGAEQYCLEKDFDFRFKSFSDLGKTLNI